MFTSPVPAAEGTLRPSVASAWPRYEEDEIAAVEAILRSGRVNALQHGEQCRAFEAEFAAFVGRPHAVAVANGSVALELALEVLGIGPGDEVVVTPRSFFASAACIRRVGAVPVFADVDRCSQNVTAATIAATLSPRTRAIVAVHLAGWPCAMDEIMALATERRLRVVEDCAQALGATWQGRPVGSFGDAAAFSFCTDKLISTGGEGGMLLLADEAAHERAQSIKDHGKDLAAQRRPSAGNVFRYLHQRFGTNWRLTEMQAAIGRRQLGKLPSWLARRRDNAARLSEALAPLPGLRLSLPPAAAGHAWYRYYAFVRPDGLRPGWDRNRVLAEIIAAGVPCFSGSCPEIYREPACVAAGFVPPEPLPVAAELGTTSLAFLVDHTLDVADMMTVASAVASTLDRAAR
jgi:dTDP-4-amino-4,6-dideoxygalactose transaminase